MAGHLFLVRGDLRNLACDAVLVPAGTGRGVRPGEIGRHWWGAWDGRLRTNADGFLDGPPPNDDDRVIFHAPAGQPPQEPAIWVGHTGRRPHEEPAWFAEAVRAFVAQASHGFTRADLGRAPLDDPRPLLALPLVGVGRGAQGRKRGEIMKRVVAAIAEAQMSANADVALVVRDDEHYAAGQQARRAIALDRPAAGDLNAIAELAELRELAELARRDRLVLFFGAGASMGAGLPSWGELLVSLADAAGLQDRIEELRRMDARDQATIIKQHLSERQQSLAQAIGHEIRGERVSLIHALMASLPVSEAVTTNYDELFETAWRDAGHHSFQILPRDHAQDATRWLLKLHGDMKDVDRLVLSRPDYLRFENEGAALGSLVQAMMLTRHMLFVGYSLSDDNLHRLVHQARSIIGGAPDRKERKPFGTALAPEKGLAEELWHGDVRFLSGGGAWNVAVLLDRIGELASAPTSYLLNEDWDALLSDPERKVRKRLWEVQEELSKQRGTLDQSVHDAITQALDELGALGDTKRT